MAKLTRKRAAWFAAGAAVVVVVGGGLVAPALVDLNSYKPLILSAVTDATGREARIDGSIRFRLLPVPTVTLSGVHLRNRDGGSEQDMLSVDRVRVRVSFSSLLSGDLRADSVRLEHPRLVLEQTPDGPNWRFEAATRRSADVEGRRAEGRMPRPPGTEAPIGQVRLAEPKEGASTAASAGDQASAPKSPGTTASAQAHADGAAGNHGDVIAAALEKLTIADGEVIVRQGGRDLRFRTINADAEAQSLSGPFKVEGTFNLVLPDHKDDGIPLSLAVGLGTFHEDLGVPVSLHLGVQGSDALAAFSGLLVGSSSGRTLRGDLTVSARNGQDLAHRLGLDDAPPLGGISMAATLSAGMDKIGLEGLTLDGGGTHAEGSFSWDHTGPLGRISGALSVGSLDLDHWDEIFRAASNTAASEPRDTAAAEEDDRPQPPPTTEQKQDGTKAHAGPSADTAVPGGGASDHVAEDPRQTQGAKPNGVAAADAAQSLRKRFALTIPDDLRGTLDLRVEALTWRQNVVRQSHMAVTFDDNGVNVDELTMQLPGSASFAVAGRIRPAPASDGGAAFDLAAQAQSDNLRSLLDWLGATPRHVAGNRLNRATLAASIGGTLREMTVSDLEAVIDTTALRGAATIRPPLKAGQRLALGLTVEAGKVNLDAYRPVKVRTETSPENDPADNDKKSAEAASPAASGASSTPASTADQASQGPVEVPTATHRRWWQQVDANLHLSAGALTWNSVPFEKVDVAGSLLRGVVTLTSASVGNIAGGSVSAHGGFKPAADGAGISQLTAMDVTIAAPDPRALAMALGQDAFSQWPDGVPLNVSVQASGPLDDQATPLSLSATSKAAGSTLAFSGQISGLLGAPGVKGEVSVSAADTRRFVDLFSPGYTPRGRLGALDGKALLTSGAGKVVLNDLDLTVGSDHLTGSVTTDLTTGHPTVTATLSADQLNLDRYRTARRHAALQGVQIAEADTVASDATPQQLSALSVDPRWSSSRWDFSALQQWNGTVDLSARRLTFGDVTLQDASGTLSVKDGKAVLDPLKATVYGGPVSASATLDVRKDVPTASLSIKGSRIGAGGLFAALAGGDAGLAKVPGRGDVDIALTTSGSSEAEAIQHLAGQGTFALSGVKPGSDAHGSVILQPLVALNKLASIGQGGRDDTVSLSSKFAANDGIVQVQGVTVTSALYQSRLHGVVNLPRWTLDIDGQARMSETLLSAFLRQQFKMPEVVPISVRGDLDKPTVTIMGSVAGPGAVSSDPADQPKVEDVVPALLDKYLGDKDKGSHSSDETTDKPKEKPEKAARDLLKGLLFR